MVFYTILGTMVIPHEKYHGIFVHGTMVEYHGTWYGIKYHGRKYHGTFYVVLPWYFLTRGTCCLKPNLAYSTYSDCDVIGGIDHIKSEVYLTL